MTAPPPVPSPTTAPPAQRFLPLLLVLFAGSGCAALTYEIVWFQWLQLVIGSSAVSLGVLLGTFMGGMCLGSIAGPRLLSARRHPWRVFAGLELGIGVCGIAVGFAIPYLERLYTAAAGQGLGGIWLRGVVGAVCLLPPTFLMGASLPAIARWIDPTPRGVSWLGLFYGGNLAGAVFGCLLAGFYLLRVYDLATATYVAAVINGVVASISLGVAARTPHRPAAGGPAPDPTMRATGSWAVYAAIAVSGLCALGAEVVWTRLLSLLLGATVYTFSIILAVFLAGLGIGSSAGSWLSRRTTRPRLALGWCQVLLSGAVAWPAGLLAASLSFGLLHPTLSTSPWLTFGRDLLRCMCALLPATCLWGASFSLAVAAVASPVEDPARRVGGIYAANTAGAIVGALAFSLLLIPGIGTQHCQRLLLGLSAAAACLAFAPLLRSAPPALGTAGAFAWVASTGLAAVLAWNLPGVPWEVVAYGRRLLTSAGHAEILYLGEGRDASIAVTQWEDGKRLFHVSGKVEASGESHDMRLQRMLGHLPALLHPHPRTVLVVGLGAGVTAGSLARHPGVEKIVICEIEPLIPGAVARYFGAENNHVLRDRRVQVVYDDARHYLLTTPDQFDIVTSDPIHPWVKGAATLYSKEYFELCRRRLRPGGLITQWAPLYESDPDTVKSELATFFDVFPNGTIWSNDIDGTGYDLVLQGQTGTARVNVDELQDRLDRTEQAGVAQSLAEVGFGSAVELLATYAGRATDLGPWLQQAPLNRDRNLRLQYLAGMGLNSKHEAIIYSQLLLYRRFPEDLFVASERRRQALRKALGL